GRAEELPTILVTLQIRRVLPRVIGEMYHVTLLLMQTKGSALADVDNGLCEGLRSLLGQIVTDAALHEAMQVFAGELLGVGGRICMWRAVLIAFEGDGRYGNLRGG